MSRLLTAGLAALAALAAAPASALGICVEGAYPPFSEVKDDGSIVGFDIDIANALCGKMGETCTLVQRTWERMIPALVGGECDAIVASMSSTEQRRALIDFSAPYYRSPVRFVGPAGAEAGDGVDVMEAKVVGVQGGTVNQFFMVSHYPATALKTYASQELALMDLDLGRVDAVLGEAVQLDAGFLKTPAGQGFAFFGADHYDPTIQGEGAAVGVRKDQPELRDRFTRAIQAIRADGSYQALSQRYFGYDIYGG